MSQTEVEREIDHLKTDIGLLKKKVEKLEKDELPWWKQIVGTFADDPAHEEAMSLGREYRRDQREDYDDRPV
ncbi:MAG TPA: hypothetical protein VK612_03420 [Pyrinomonadaceae bacterium]|nr:hypothetical protein [Pyrinomonadaceae bacterium]